MRAAGLALLLLAGSAAAASAQGSRFRTSKAESDPVYGARLAIGGLGGFVNYGVGVAIPVGSLRLRADLKDQVDLCKAPDEFDADAFEACFEDEALHPL